MFVNQMISQAKRRGVVLILMLGMLALLALIGVTFATLSGQARVNARNYMQALNVPDESEMMDFALAQLIDDTGLPTSALRGHSIGRDMYGKDGDNNGLLVYKPTSGNVMKVTASKVYTEPSNGRVYTKFATDISTISTDPDFSDFYSYNFTRWILRLVYTNGGGFLPDGSPIGQILPVAQTFEIISDNPFGNDADYPGVRVFIVANSDDTTTNANPPPAPLANRYLAQPPKLNTDPAVPFVLDGRYMRAFNGPGMDALGRGISRYANFRVNGNIVNQAYRFATGASTTAVNELDTTQTYAAAPGNPNDPLFPGMDEDYDACDMENWFLALQSADGQVIIPSFHRPGILRHDPGATPPFSDWLNTNANTEAISIAKILRPRAVDHPGSGPSFPNLIPDPTTGKIEYDVDNDGDGRTDSVWLDLGYPPRRDAQGKLFKPLFSFMVIGLNGRLPLNTVGNLSQRDSLGTPQFSQATHLGNSPSEIDPTWALQNANAVGNFFQDQADNAGSTAANAGVYDPSTGVYTPGPEGISVALTQLRNLLAGTRSFDGGIDNGDTNFAMTYSSAGRVPVFMPNGIADMGDYLKPFMGVYLSPFAGGEVTRLTRPIPGRWGDPGLIPRGVISTMTPSPLYLDTATPRLIYQTPVAPGLPSWGYVGSSGSPRYIGGTGDDNLNSYDVYGEAGDQYDVAGGQAVAAERERRFVTPSDATGDGRILTWEDDNTNSDYTNPLILDTGGDPFGRFSFFKYFRPPGISPATAAYPTGVVINTPVLPDQTNNLYHGFEGARNPRLTGLINPVVGGMPYNVTTPTPITPAQALPLPPPAQPQTYNPDVFNFYASGNPDASGTSRSFPPFALGNMNEPDEVNLYAPGGRDRIFGPADLEWLYRLQDSDGASLSSRLKDLAPVSFTNALDGTRRRRLFSLESWEPTNYVWANDNPLGTFPNNSRFDQFQSANFVNLPGRNGQAQFGSSVPDPLTLTISPAPTYSYSQPWHVPTPALAHRDRKINLNFPLPVSNDPKEPVRQKWIRETYQLLKAILPPKAVDTPQELAQLSQYVVNIIDFRDPDCTTTKFVNTDITVTQATTTTPATLAFTTTPLTTHPDYSPEWGTTEPYLVQYGMEYPPIAINEVLAFSFKTKGASPPTVTPRMFVEVVNTLTESALTTTTAGVTTNACDLDLLGWDFVILPDDATGRPDPTTGQVPLAAPSTIKSYPVGIGTGGPLIAPPTSFTALSPRVPALKAENVPGVPANRSDRDGHYYYVFANPQPKQADNTDAETGDPPSSDIATELDLTKELTIPNKYYWLYLRRPPNPFFLDYDPSQPNENRVVVDSFRFIFNASTGDVTGAGTTRETVTTPTTENLYSLQRMQPYRGGQMIGSLPADTPPAQVAAFGYSEQTTAGLASGSYYGQYHEENDSSGTSVKKQEHITGKIAHSLGRRNHGINSSAIDGRYDDQWDPLVFHDRDFTSVAELLMVPGCPPGLFTKQFCEQAPPLSTNNYIGWLDPNPPLPADATKPMATLFPPAATPQPAAPPQFRVANPEYNPDGTLRTPAAVPRPHTFPYLVDNFFYTGASEITYPGKPSDPTPPTPPYIGGPSGAGWSKMFEFFEVPSPAVGATGLVAQGNNFDWFRQDLKPGLLNLNLIIDEEVFLGLMGFESSVSYQQAKLNNGYSDLQLNMTQLPNNQVPLVVTQLDSLGNPFNAGGTLPGYVYQFPNNGAFAVTNNPAVGDGGSALKAAFGDFLRLRHGGTQYLFGMEGNRPIDRPFHALSYPDLNYTVMRPASTPPPLTALNPPPPGPWPTATWPYNGYVQDPAVKNFYLAATSLAVQPPPIQPPPIPARRLFQLPDAYGSNTGATEYSNASVPGDNNVNQQYFALPAATPPDLTIPPDPNPTAPRGGLSWLGNHNGDPLLYPAVPFKQPDLRQHPYFRTEWMQRVMNLTTVRTHQFAVWITVGFFEVTQAGNPQMAATNPAAAYDRLGLELGALAGSNVRYRGFFLLDRTRAVGFNPGVPGNFRDVIVYRKQIE